MRARDFLVEYNQAVTVKKMGDDIANAVLKDPSGQKIVGQRLALTATTNDPELRNDSGQIKLEIIAKLALDIIERADPTPNKQYVQWLSRVYANSWNRPTSATGKGMWLEDVVSTVADRLHKYHELNRRKMIPRPKNDINYFRDFNSFLYDVDQMEEVPVKGQEENKGKAVPLYDDENWRVLIPQDQTAACYYGRGTRWCTAATKGSNYFRHYNNIAPLMILIPKHPDYDGEKYQVHFGVSYGDGVGNSYPVMSDDDIENIVNNEYADQPGEAGIREIYNDVMRDLEFGQIMDEQDDPMNYNVFTNRVGDSWTNILDAYLKAFPDRQWQVETNLDGIAGTDEEY